MKFLNKKSIVAVVAIVAITSLTGCGKIKDTDVVATVGKDQITGGVANFYARLQQAQSETYYGSYMSTADQNMWEQEVEEGTTFEESVKKSTIEGLEDMYLLKQHASDYDVTLTDEDNTAIEKATKKFIDANSLEDKEVVSGQEEYVKEVLELMTIQNKMDTAMKAGVDENVSDDEAAQKSMDYVFFAYSTTDDDGNAVDMTDDEKAAQLQAAKDFAATIKNNKLSAAAKAAGLETTTATFDSSSTSPAEELVKAADAIEEKGDITDVIETDTGCYIAKVTSFLDKDATASKKEEIIEERKQTQYDDLLKGFKDDTEIKLNKSVWNKISFIDQGVTMKQETEEPYATGTDDTDTETEDTAE